jgi:hypothetical protein
VRSAQQQLGTVSTSARRQSHECRQGKLRTGEVASVPIATRVFNLETG